MSFTRVQRVIGFLVAISSLMMLLGRLEVYTLLVLLAPAFWRD
jgi:Trk-type K+ transport system membrane component